MSVRIDWIVIINLEINFFGIHYNKHLTTEIKGVQRTARGLDPARMQIHLVYEMYLKLKLVHNKNNDIF